VHYKLVLRWKYCTYILISYIRYLRLCRWSEGDLWVDGSERARKPNSFCHPHSLPSRTTIKHAEVLKDPPLLLLPHSPTTLWHLTHSDVQPNGARPKERQRRRKRMDGGFRRTIETSNAKSDWHRSMNFWGISCPFEVFIICIW